MKNFYDLDSQIIEAEGEMKKLQAKFEGPVWAKYVAIAIGMGIAGLLVVTVPIVIVGAVVEWILGLFGGGLGRGFKSGLATLASSAGFLGGFAFAIYWGVTSSKELSQRLAQLSTSLDDLRRQRDDYLRSSTD